MSPDRQIRQAAFSQAANILALQKRAYQSEAVRFTEDFLPPMTQSLAQLEKEFTTHTFYIVTDSTEISDYDCCAKGLLGSVKICYDDNLAYLGRLVVEPEVQGQGIGSMLLDHAEQSACGMTVELFTGSASLDNIRFYTKRGYRKFKQVKVSSSLVLLYFRKKI